jgi:DNA invertase Pin-like site-specific DNA recombinase
LVCDTILFIKVLEENMLVGYARVSTQEQNLDRQIDALIAAGVDNRTIYQEKITGTKAERPELDRMINELKNGDTVIVSDLTRLSRSTKDLFNIVEKVESKGANIKSLKESWLDTTTPHGKLLFTIFSGISQFERDLISQRTKEGLASARARGRKGGRKPKEEDSVKKAIKLYNSQEYPVREIEEMTGVSRATLYRKLKESKTK